MPERFQSKVISNENITDDIKHLVLTTPNNFTFLPGQYISIIADSKEKKLRRPYSICSNPIKNKIELCIKIIPNGALTPQINNLKQGDKLEILGPLGTFRIKDKEKKLIFISTGTGIAPFRSMIKDLLKNNHKKQITLIAGYKNNPLYDKEFKSLSRKHANLTYKTALSSKGKRVIDLLPINPEADYYLCGLKEMIDSVRSKLTKGGVQMSSIITEKYD